MTYWNKIAKKVGRLHSAARFFAVACVILLVTAVSAVAQNRTVGEIRGTVTDQSGARIPGAVVDLLNQDTGVNTQLTTNSDGVYDAPSLVPGIYTVTVTRQGFKTSVETGLLLHAEAITANATLGVGSATEKVTVEATTAQVQTESAEVRTDLNTVMARELPNVGVSENKFLQLLPGIMPSGGFNQGGQVSGTSARNGDNPAINGQQGGQQQWTMDGGTRTINSGGTWLAQVPIDAIDTMNYVAANFGAEYGNGLSVFNATTKGGTNKWHGTAYEFVQNDFFNARNYFSYNRPYVAPFKWNNYGGTVGGPIKRDKAFFFFSYQNNPTKNFAQGYFTFPTDAMRAGDFSQVPGLDANGNSTGQPIPLYDPTSLSSAAPFTRTPLPGNKMTPGQISPVSAAIQAWFPKPNFMNPNQPGQNPQACAATEGVLPAGCFQNNMYFSTGVTINNFVTYNGKVDYDLRANNRLEASLMVTKNHNPLGFNAGAPFNGQLANDFVQYTGQLSDFWTARPNLVNEFRVAINRFDGEFYGADNGKGYSQKVGLTNDLSTMAPGVAWGGQFGTSFNSNWPEFVSHHVDNTYVPSDIVTWVKGKHILKIGGEFDKWEVTGTWNNPEYFGFNGIATENPATYNPQQPYTQGLGYADFLFGQVTQWSSTIGPSTGSRAKNVQLFVQDDYKVRKNLTVNIGLRYEIATAWGESKNRISTFSPTLLNPATGTPGAVIFGTGAVPATHNLLFAPRFGFSYSPKDKWAIRGGYGIFYVQEQSNTYGGNNGAGYNISGSANSTDNVHPAFQWNSGIPGYVQPTAANRTPDVYNGQGIGYVPHIQPLTYSQQWQVGVQHETIGGFLVDAAYVATRGVHLPFSRDVNQVPVSLLFHYDPAAGTDMQPYRPFPQFQGISADYLDGFSMYNALQVSVKKQFTSGLSLITNYTQSKNHDTGTTTANNPGPDLWQNAHSVQANYATSATDAPYVFNGGAVYQVPLGKGKQFLNHGGILDAVVGGWQVSGLWSLHSGLTFTPAMFDNASGSLAGSWLPIRVGNPMKAGTVAGNPGCVAPSKIHNLANWFNPCAYVSPAAATFGQNLRNSLRGPAWRSVDMSLAKSFRLPFLGEAAGLQIKMDATDALNHPNFSLPNSTIGSNTTGLINGAQTSRGLQLGSRLTF